jgi:hypothetical protein
MMLAVLAVQGIVFAIWAYWMFRCLFLLRRAAIAETGRGYPGLRATLRQFGLFARSDLHQADRRVLVVLTLVLLGLTLAFALLASPSGAG